MLALSGVRWNECEKPDTNEMDFHSLAAKHPCGDIQVAALIRVNQGP